MVAENEIHHMQQVMDKIKRARYDITRSLDVLFVKRDALAKEIEALERQLSTLDHLSTAHMAIRPRYQRSPGESLSRRVVGLLKDHETGLTFHDIKEHLTLDQRESRNLGPVLNQMAKAGKIVATGRGMPWHLPEAELAICPQKPDQADHRDWQKAKDLLVKGAAVTFEETEQTSTAQQRIPNAAYARA